jgi:hypothetical protein
MTGRNDPCPCGSGRKFKKCCIDKPRAGVPHRRAESAGRSSPDSRLGPEELVSRLRGLGVDASRDAFLELARRRTSAWAVSDVWRGRAEKRLSVRDDDFLGIAACALWEHYCPERASVEMLDDWMQEGYELSRSGKGPHACDRWAEVWEVIRGRLEPHMDTCESATPVFDGTQSLFNWIQDYRTELLNAAVGEPRYALAGVRLCEQALAQFHGESFLFRLNFRADLGVFHFRAGQPEEGERVLRALIRDHPDCAAGYVTLSECLCEMPAGPSALDRERAAALLEEALARPVTDADDYDVAARLADLRRPTTADPQ